MSRNNQQKKINDGEQEEKTHFYNHEKDVMWKEPKLDL